MRNLFAILVCLFFYSICQSQSFHSVLVINPADPEYGISRQKDLFDMHRFMRGVSNDLNYTYCLHLCGRETFTTSAVMDTVRSLNVSEDDIVFFYFSGHGHNDGSGKWPVMTLSDTTLKETGVFKALEVVSAKAKLLICIADCCNRESQSRPIGTYAHSDFDGDNIKKLFLEFPGKLSIIASGAKVGTYGYANPTEGQLFGHEFMAAIAKAKEKATWDSVFQEACSSTMKCTEAKGYPLQTPQYEIQPLTD